MKRYFYHWITLLFVGSLSPAFALAEEAEKSLKDLEMRGSDCILIRTIRDYTPLDDRHLLIRGPAKRAYLVTLHRSAFGVRSAFSLGFSSRDDQLCPYGGDSIVFGGLNSEQVGIRSISRVTKEQAEELKLRYSRKKPTEITPSDPEAVKGAEVEELDREGR